MAFGPNLRIAVERAEAHGDVLTLRPPVAEQAGAANRAEGFDPAAVGPVDPDELLSLNEAELLAGNMADRQPERAGMLAATRAVAVDRAREGQCHLEPDAAAKTAAADDLGHAASLDVLRAGDAAPTRTVSIC
jgi:hypothetical protein